MKTSQPQQTVHARTAGPRRATPLALVGEYLAVIARDSCRWVAAHWLASVLAAVFVLANLVAHGIYAANGWDWSARACR